MTIVIDVRWIDKIHYWKNKHSDDFSRYFYLSLLILSPPTLIIGVMKYIDYWQDDSIYIPLHFILLFMIGGLIGTIILTYLIVATLIELNDEHKWFSLKRLEKNN